MLQIIILSTILIFIALLGLSIKLLTNKKAVFRTGSCNALPPEFKDNDLSCGCGGHCQSEI